MLAKIGGSKELAVGSEILGDKLIAHANQDSTSIDRQGKGYQDFPFGGRKDGNKIGVDFGWNADEKIVMNPSTTIRTPRP